MDKESFQYKLEYGRHYEEIAQAKIKEASGIDIVLIQNNDNYLNTHYDFKTSDGTTYEVKSDAKSSITGNFFIEVKNGRREDSGLSITEALYHILVNNETFYLIKTDNLKALVRSGLFRTAFVPKDGTKGFLIPVAKIAEYSKVI